MNEISSTELWNIMCDGRPVCLLDVREPEEQKLAHLDGATLIPLGELSRRINEVVEMEGMRAERYIVFCRSGVRSAKALSFLESYGLSRWENLKGGLNALARETNCGILPY